MCFAFNISAGHVPRALLTIMRTSKCLLWSLSPSLLQNRIRKLSTVMKSMRKIIFPIEMIRKRLLLILIIYTTVFATRSNHGAGKSQNFSVHLLTNSSIVDYCHLYICSFQFHFLCFNLSFSFSLFFNMCLNMLFISFQKQEMQKGYRDLNSYEITIFYSMIIYNIIIYLWRIVFLTYLSYYDDIYIYIYIYILYIRFSFLFHVTLFNLRKLNFFIV